MKKHLILCAKIPVRILEQAKWLETLNHSEVTVTCIRAINQTKNIISGNCFRVLIIRLPQKAIWSGKRWNVPFVKKYFQVMLKFFNFHAILNTFSTLNAYKTGYKDKTAVLCANKRLKFQKASCLKSRKCVFNCKDYLEINYSKIAVWHPIPENFIENASALSKYWINCW